MAEDIPGENARRVTLRAGTSYRLTHANGDTVRVTLVGPVLNTGDEVMMIIAPDLEDGPLRIDIDEGADGEGRERADEDT